MVLSKVIQKFFYKGAISMNNLQLEIQNYLNYCQNQKRLDEKTLKAYRIDLRQFHTAVPIQNISVGA